MIIHLLVLRPILKFLFGVNLFGMDNLKDMDHYILIANHNSHIDILLLFYLLPVKHINKTHPVAAKEYFGKSKLLFSVVNFLFEPVWISRGDKNCGAKFLMDVCGKLDKGHNLIIFPEGTRGEPGELQSFKSGVGSIAEKYRDVPIIPVLVSGTEKSLPKQNSIPVPIWHNLIIGKPQIYSQSSKEITKSLENIIREFQDEENAFRHKRKIRNRKPVKTIAFIGIDGSGKSTLSRNVAMALSKNSKVARVSDVLNYYENSEEKKAHPFISEQIRTRVSGHAKSARSLKQYKIPKLTELLLRNVLLNELKRWYHPDYAIMDGSPLLNLTSWAILYKEKYFNEEMCSKVLKVLSANDKDVLKDDPVFTQFSELEKMKKIKLNNFNLPDMVIFLDIDPKVSVERINKRGENIQVHETFEKLSKLREAYHVTCKVAQNDLNISVSIIEGENSVKDIEDMATSFVLKNINTEKV